MPFKGDMRLGGARRNDSTMNGMSEGPSYPAAGTIISLLDDVGYPTSFGGLTVDVSTDPLNPDLRESQTCDVYVKADGAGGTYTDYANAFNIEFYPDNTVIYSIDGYSNDPSVYVSEVDASFTNGSAIGYKVHDGMGGWRVSEVVTYYSYGTFITEAVGQGVTASYQGQEYGVGTGTRQFRHNGSGGYYSEMVNVVYISGGAVVGSYSSPYTIQLPDGNYYSVGTTTSDVQTDGTGGLYSVGGSTSYSSYGTYITNFGGNNYYSDGNGSYYSEGDGSGSGGYPSYGSTTGNTSSGTNYISINGNSYENGSYSSTEYHDGNGGTYWETSYSYAPYGTQFFSESYTDEYGSTYNVYYYSDGGGSYYTGS